MSTPNRPPRSASVASFLSFLWPGLGQAWQGRRRSALLWAVPPLTLVVLVLAAAAGGLDVVAAELLTPSVAITVFGLVVLLGIWRILSIVDASSRGVRQRAARSVSVVAVLVAIVIGTHAVPAYYTWSLYQADSRIFVGQSTEDATPGANATPDPNATDGPDANTGDFVAEPDATPATSESRINVLVTGIDSGHGRNHALTDTLLVVSVDPLSKSVAMLSLPRDLANFPLSDGRTYTGKINSLMTYARLHPKEFPDGGLHTLIKEVGYLLGVPIHYYAAINLDGFVKMIDMVGGVTINNPRAISDARYDWMDGSPHGFYLSAGKHKLNGRTALAYARSRQGIGDSDFTRAARQQEVLVALRTQLTKPAIIGKVPDLLDAAASSVRTNFPQDRIGEMVRLAQAIGTSKIKQYVLGPPYSVHPPTSQTGGTYELRLVTDKVAALSVKLFGSESRYYKP